MIEMTICDEVTALELLNTVHACALRQNTCDKDILHVSDTFSDLTSLLTKLFKPICDLNGLIKKNIYRSNFYIYSAICVY